MGRSNEVLGISTDDLKRAAPTFDKQSEALRKAAATLQGKLEALGAPWGGDEQGSKFGNAYNPSRDKIDNAVSILVTGLASINVAMADMADGHISNEENIKGMFTAPPPVYGPPKTPYHTGGDGPVHGPPVPPQPGEGMGPGPS